jgi:hypothetical protein
MIKFLPIFFILIFSESFSQTIDTLHSATDNITQDLVLSVENKDSLSVSDSIKTVENIVQPDTLTPIQGLPLSDFSHIIDRRTFLFTNYRYAGDLLRSFSLNFIKDLGFTGQPHETFIYGIGNNGISYFQEGVLWNNRYTNLLDLNLVQSEDIDSIEIIPSPRGFLYGPYNNPVAVNFIMRDFISPEPYSRIKYYEGPDGETMIDGKFNAQIYKRWNLSLQVTNRISDDRYTNSEFSIWLVNTKLKYFLSNSVNISALYSSVDSDVGLNGGIDVDSIAKLTSDINSVLFDNQLAIVNYPKRIQKVLNHNLGLKTQALPWQNAQVNLSVFYKYAENEISNDLDSVVLKERYDNKNYGAALNFRQKLDIVTIQLLSSYEKNRTQEYQNYLLENDITTNHDYFSVSSILSLNLLSEKLVPSVFYKYTNQSIYQNNSDPSNNNSGIGIDISYKPFECLSIYSGYSRYNQFDITDVKSFEVGANYKKANVLADIKFFSRNKFIPVYIKPPILSIDPGVELNSIKGLGLLVNYKFWKLLVETNTTYYFDLKGYSLFTLPEIQFVSGIYLNDNFFDESLLLKAGIKFYYMGKLSAHAENSGVVNDEPSNKIDISVAGEIKKVAIVYFIWENLFNNQYFITPYYPMPERNIRFGLAWELFN